LQRPAAGHFFNLLALKGKAPFGTKGTITPSGDARLIIPRLGRVSDKKGFVAIRRLSQIKAVDEGYLCSQRVALLGSRQFEIA
jgi:hypothetical protein